MADKTFPTRAPSSAFITAEAILAADPLPPDAYEQLEALEQQIRSDEEELFGELWEAYYAAAYF